jgi:hypothetical protein
MIKSVKLLAARSILNLVYHNERSNEVYSKYLAVYTALYSTANRVHSAETCFNFRYFIHIKERIKLKASHQLYNR